MERCLHPIKVPPPTHHGCFGAAGALLERAMPSSPRAGALRLGCRCLSVPAMADLGMVTPRAKRRRKESSRDQGLSATKAGARRRARSGQSEGDQGEHRPLWGWDPLECVPCPPMASVTPGKGRLAKLRLEGERRRPASASPRERKPVNPLLQPCYKGAYFSGLPADECQDPAVPTLLVPAAPVPGRDGPRKTRSTPERTLVLELEGTLVCSSVLSSWWQGAAATFTTVFQGDSYEVHVKLRPHVQQFLESLSKTYEIFIFTTAKQDYAEKVLDVLDPRKKLIRHCLTQRDCLCARGSYWKDLTCLGRDLAKTVALDHTIQGVPAQAANWIPVPRWWGDPRDEELLHLTPLLGQLAQLDDVRTEIQRRFPHGRLPAED
ncbi:CTD nuclear envelope phosphatase 1A-like isoform X3 [Phalacrocorax aristotelis]|uniref:CTD nuclear envelope phosphatase 1A-like isoform X3 n=1 Tax=Phalacrocorax aristotelis TaxID=126867 RepID=UPI003F4C1A5B